MTLAGILACLLLVAGPGVGGSLAAYGPEEIGLPSRAALAFALACLIPAVLALALALGGVLAPIPFFALLGAATAALWVVGLARGRGGDHVRAFGRELRSDPWTLGAGAVVIAAIAVSRLMFSSALHFSTSSSWRYWADAVEVADAGRIPETVLQYGAAFPPVVNKVLVSTLGAGLTFGIGTDPLPGMAAMLWLSSVGLAVALWSTGREMGLRFTAALFPVLVMSNRLFLNEEMSADLTGFKAETFGRLVALTGLAVAVKALRDRRRKDAVVAGALIGAAAAMHIVPDLIVMGLLAFYGIARLLIDRDPVPLAIRVGLVVGVAAVVGGIMLFVPRTEVAVSPGSGRTDAAQPFDPTRYLNSGQTVPIGDQRRWYIGPRRALTAYVGSATHTAPGSGANTILKIGLPVAGLAVAIVLLAWGPQPIRAIGFTALGLAGLIVALTWLFSLRYRLYIPAFFGVRRLFDYGSIPLLLAGLGLAEWAALLLQKTTARASAICAVVVVVVAAVFIQTARVEPRPSSPAAAEAFAWIAARLPCDARILPDVHTEGVFEALTGRVSVLEGPTPYLRARVRDRVIQLFQQARAFFRQPERARPFLDRQGVGYVALFKRGGFGYHGPIGAGDPIRMDRAKFLRRLYASPVVDVYQVRQPRTVGFPDPGAFPGYACRRPPFAL